MQNEELINQKKEQIARLEAEIKELMKDDSNSELEKVRQKYVGCCYSPAAECVRKILDISLVFDERHFQATYLNINIPYRYIKIYEKDGRIPSISEMDPVLMPHIETETEEVCIRERLDGTQTIDNGNFITDREFEDMYNLALAIFRPMVYVNRDACLMYFNKENLEIV
jgi:hypothetical protein